MEADHFFSRWSKKKAESQEAVREADVAPNPAPTEPVEPAPPPTIEDVEQLTADSDYTSYMAQGVDDNVRRSAMKKLFTDPHFNIMDGLDIYIDDYSKPDPLPPGMLEMLNHAKSLLDPLKHLESPAMRMIGKSDLATPAPVDDATGGKKEALEAGAAGDQTNQTDTDEHSIKSDAEDAASSLVQPQTPELPADVSATSVSTPAPASNQESAGAPNQSHHDGAPDARPNRTS